MRKSNISDEQRRVARGFYLDEASYQRLKMLAVKHQRSMSGQLRFLIERADSLEVAEIAPAPRYLRGWLC